MTAMKIICIEGLDGVGKETVAKKLVEIINTSGHRAEYVDFPQYSSISGLLINELLHDYIGDISNINQNLISPIYTIDRIHWFKENLSKKMKTLDYLVLDRGFYSNFMYQASKLYSNKNWDIDIANWLLLNYNWEFVLTGLDHVPDIETVVLTISEDDRRDMIIARAKSKESLDSNEANYIYLDKVSDFFYSMNKPDTYNIPQLLTTVMMSLSNDTKTVGNINNYYFKNVREVVITRSKSTNNDFIDVIKWNAMKVIHRLNLDEDLFGSETVNNKNEVV